MTKLVGVVAEATLDGMVARASQALEAGADLVEFRLDCLPQASLADALVLAPKFGSKAIATLRSQPEGGASTLTIGDRMRTLRELAQAGFAYLDVELRGDAPVVTKLRDIAQAGGTALIASVHPPGLPGPREVEELLRLACGAADVGKVAADAATVGRVLEFMELAEGLRDEGRRFCLIAKGGAGVLTRVRAEAMGNEFDYVVPPGGQATAPGQLGLERALALSQASPILLGLIGYPVAQSPSPAMHTAALDYLGIPGIYLPLPTPPDELAAVVASLADLEFRGVNVTSPHKVSVVTHLDAMDVEASAVGAVNTIAVGPDGSLVGHNTDTHGFRALLDEASLDVTDRSVLLLGAGGGARATAYVLVADGARVTIFNRSLARAEALAADIPPVHVAREAADLSGKLWDVVVNCTPPGPLSPKETLGEVFGPRTTAIDLAYDPTPTPFLREAQRNGCRPVGGLSMLLHQGAKSLEVWLGKPAPLEVMRKALEVLG